MARSRRRTPITKITTARSDKRAKRLANRKLRQATNRAILLDNWYDDVVMPERKEVSNVYYFPSDGKMYSEDLDAKWRRK